MMQRRSYLLLCAFTLAFTATLPAQAQTFGRVGTVIAEGSAYHVFAKPGEATVQIQVLGNVKFPGIYEVGAGTDLGQLLALTGGPVQVFTEGRVVRRTETTMRLYHGEGGRRDLVYEAAFETMLTNPGNYPVLQDGDVFNIETLTFERTQFGWRDGLTIVATLATVALVIDRIIEN